MYFHKFIHISTTYTYNFSLPFYKLHFLNWNSCLWFILYPSHTIFRVELAKHRLLSKALKQFFLCKHLLLEFKQKSFGFHCAERLNILSCFFLYLKINDFVFAVSFASEHSCLQLIPCSLSQQCSLPWFLMMIQFQIPLRLQKIKNEEGGSFIFLQVYLFTPTEHLFQLLSPILWYIYFTYI